MTKDEWEKVQEALKNLYSFVKLQIDGYEVSLTLARVGEYELAIMFYVGGKFEYRWIAEDCEERRRFCRKSTRSLLSAKQKADLKKMSKRMQQELLKGRSTTYDIYTPYWKSFAALKKHLIANNEAIELISIT